MPWCPGCSYEYVAGRRKCPDCGFPLNKLRIPSEIKLHGRSWVPIRQVPDRIHAEIIRSFLNDHGYEVAIRNGDGTCTVSDDPPLLIFVPASSARKAASLLRTESCWTREDLEDYLNDSVEVEDYEDDYDVEEDDELLSSDDLVEYFGDDENF